MMGKVIQEIRTAHRLAFHTPPLRLGKTDYDQYWQAKRGDQGLGTLSEWQRQRADWILPRMEEGSSVLDIGCGDGSLLRFLKERKRAVPMGADISDYTLEYLRSQGIQGFKLDINQDSATAGLPEADYIVLFEVLEHIQNPEVFLQQAYAKARKAVFFSVPNSGYFPYRLRLCMGSFLMQWRLHPGEHLRFWTYRDMLWWLKELGFGKNSTLTAYEGIPGLNRIWKGLFGMGMIGEIRRV